MGGQYKTAEALVEAMQSLWPNNQKNKFVVLTGGEPLLQVDKQSNSCTNMTSKLPLRRTAQSRYEWDRLGMR